MKKIVFPLVLVAGVALFFVVHRASTQNTSEPVEKKPAKQTVDVQVQTAGSSKTLSVEKQYPASVVADQEVILAAKTSGTVVTANFEEGDKIGVGRQLAVIDDTGSSLAASESGLMSSQIQQLENAMEQADEAKDLARENYKDQKNDATKTAKEIAELQYDNAETSLQAAIDSHYVKAPIAGTVTRKHVNAGDSIAAGQPVATISKNDKVNIQFFVDPKERNEFLVGQSVRVEDSAGNTIDAKITSVASQADPATKRFLVKAQPKVKGDLLAGNIVTVNVTSRQTAVEDNAILLPLSALTVGQNENFIFIVEDSKAKKVTVEVAEIVGETAKIVSPLEEDTQIIVRGNKLVTEGETVNIQ